MTQCNHFGRAGFADVDEDEVIVVEAVEAAETKEPEVEPAKKSTEYAYVFGNTQF